MDRKSRVLAGFTLLEVVLAIGLAGVVLALLTTAIDLYLVRVDVNRTRVESAQLARTLLTQMADDLRAARYWSPSSGSSGGSNSAASTDTEASAKVLGIFGTATELRIDRGARWRWERIAQEIDAISAAAADEMPQTVQYIFNSGDTLLASRMAALGVLADPALPGYAGLYRQQAATSAWIYQTSATGVSVAATTQSAPELLAPEVLELEFKYFDGQQVLEQWDSAQQGRLPRGVEIRLVVLEEPFELAMIQSPQERTALLRSKENEVEYRLYVRLPNVRPRSADGPRRRSRQDVSRGSGGSRGGSSDDSSSD
ncbi:MAG: prepilin-type N-terminal cleavage/methylation domain-containing protein [Planctomycetes bacterium]|nr:prepilin-type N-terminal cleavage/methylation domain-containing protein [Planctomycetota bacterium]